MHEAQRHSLGQRGYRRIVFALFAAGFATFAQLFDTQALLPLLSREFALSPAEAALSVSASTVGLSIGVLPWSILSDKVGRVLVMKWSVSLSGILAVLTPVMPTYASLLAIRGASGIILAAVPAVAMTYLVEELDARSAPIAAGTFVAGNTIGGLAGRLIAGPIGDMIDWRWGLAAVSIVTIAASIMFVLLIPQASQFRPRTRVIRSRRATVPVFLRDPAIWGLYVQGFFVMGGFVIVYNYLGYRLSQEPFRFPLSITSAVFLLYLVGSVAAQRSGILALKVGRLRAIVLGAVAVVAGALLTIPDHIVLIVLGVGILTAGCFTAHPLSSSWVPRLTLGSGARAVAVYQILYYFGTTLFGWLGGIIYDVGHWNLVVIAVCGMAVASATIAGVTLHSRPG